MSDSNINQSEFFKIIGIGAFLFLSIQELSYFLERIIRDIHSIIISDLGFFLWLPEAIGLVFFILLTTWAFNIVPKMFKNGSKKILIFLIVIFLAVLFFQLIYSRLGTDFILDNNFDEFEAYFEARKNPLTQITIGIIHLLKYVVFVLLLIMKRKTVTNNDYNL